MNWLCASRGHIRGEKTLSCWNTPTTATPTHSSISAHTNSTAPEAAARSLGCTLLRLQMITAERIGVVTGKLAQNMLVMLPKSSSVHGRRAVASPRTLRKHCPASAARSFFRRIIWRRFMVTCAGQARCASRTKCRWDSGAWENIFGDSNRRESFRTSWFWASRSAMGFRSRRWSPRRRSPIRLTMGWSFSARLAAIQSLALRVGAHLIEGLKSLQTRHALIGDVRGSGLFLGIDLVLDRETREAAPLQASYVVNRLRDCGILAGTDGPRHNVIKLRPPLVFSVADAELFVNTLDAILQEDAAQPSR